MPLKCTLRKCGISKGVNYVRMKLLSYLLISAWVYVRQFFANSVFWCACKFSFYYSLHLLRISFIICLYRPITVLRAGNVRMGDYLEMLPSHLRSTSQRNVHCNVIRWGKTWVSLVYLVNPASVSVMTDVWTTESTERVKMSNPLHRCIQRYTLWVKKDQRYFPFITLPNVDRFSKFFHFCMQQEICNKILVTFSTTPWLCSYTTLWNLICDFCHFTTTAVIKTYIEVYSVFLFNVIHIILCTSDSTVTSVMCEICCKFFIFQRNIVSAQWMCTASVSVSPTSDFWNGR